MTGKFGMAILLAGLAHCGEVVRDPKQPPSKDHAKVSPTPVKALGATTDSAGIHWPDFRVVAQGHLLRPGRVDTAVLVLESRPEGLSGSFRKAGDSAYVLRDIRSTRLDTSAAGPLFTARFRLDYAVDACQHTAPAPPTAPIQWGHCFHYAGKPRPTHLVRGEAKVEVQILNGIAVVTAVGFPDTGSLDEVYRVKGTQRP